MALPIPLQYANRSFGCQRPELRFDAHGRTHPRESDDNHIQRHTGGWLREAPGGRQRLARIL
jgi:hypothetical protein